MKHVSAEYTGLIVVLMLLIGVFGVFTDSFFQAPTFAAIANRIPDLTFIVVGMTLVLIVGGIDLSVGSLLALSSAVIGVLMVQYACPSWLAVLAALSVTGLCGLLSGLTAVWFRIPSFIVTLGMLEMARGATKVITESRSIYIGNSIESFGAPSLGLPFSIAFVLACGSVVMGQVVLTRTVFGRYCLAIGANREAARMSGVRVLRYSISVFAISGMMCGLAGLSHVSRLSTADPNAATGIELAAIAACVIGGTSLMGGRGTVVGSFLGVLIIAVLQSGLAQMGVSDANKQLVTGGVIVLAVLVDAVRVSRVPRVSYGHEKVEQ